MSFWDFARGPASVRWLLAFGGQRGLTETDLLARSKLSPTLLEDPACEVSAVQELRVVENLLRLLKSPPGLGLAVGLGYRSSTFGLWGYGLLCSATMGDALTRALRFIQLTYAYSAIEVVMDAEACHLRMQAPALSPGVSRFLVERDLAAAAALLSEVGGPGFKLETFELQRGRGRSHRPPVDMQRVAGIWPRWDADAYRLSFAARWLQHKLPNANPTTATQCDDLCAQLVERRRRHGGTVRLVQQLLEATAPEARAGASRFAHLTSTSERTLRRRLQAEGLSFRAMLAATQAQEALELIADRSLTITAIAERMGYADLSTFSQAFKRWHGVSPALYRRGQR